jgi:hypothetical protein
VRRHNKTSRSDRGIDRAHCADARALSLALRVGDCVYACSSPRSC